MQTKHKNITDPLQSFNILLAQLVWTGNVPDKIGNSKNK